MVDLSRRQLLVIVAGVAALALVVVGVWGLVHGRGRPPATAGGNRPVPIGSSVTPTPALSTAPAVLLPHTSDPVAYARAVAESLFTWDASSGLLPTDYMAAVLADADPSGEEAPGLITDVGTYLPTVDQWLDLATMRVSQTLEIDKAAVPASWAEAVAQSRGQLRPGTTAVTITGVRHRRGVWHGTPAESSYPVTFTVFVACPPAFERCHVLRLSQLDYPLR
ncbi:MAG: hypothetical protein KDB63_12480 [Nocardioidaceae bacterium]|nr:hypothetical protein [Nocardioidaceae bacterium]